MWSEVDLLPVGRWRCEPFNVLPLRADFHKDFILLDETHGFSRHVKIVDEGDASIGEEELNFRFAFRLAHVATTAVFLAFLIVVSSARRGSRPPRLVGRQFALRATNLPPRIP